jgi:hypothetical protein
MIYINPNRIHLPPEWEATAATLKAQLLQEAEGNRSVFINAKRMQTWGSQEVVTALRNVVGNKCWYSEVELTGADPNIDHFRPKGRVREIDVDSLKATGLDTDGYWWLAFDYQNFRLSSQHANQRRVDETTDGGKWDYFPVDGARAPEGSKISLITEVVFPLDPCSATDVSLMWFGPDGTPGYSNWKRQPSIHEQRRMKVTVWLFHLDKQELMIKRSNAMEELRAVVKTADAIYNIWVNRGKNDFDHEKTLLDALIADIHLKISDGAPHAGAKRCALQIAKSEFLWLNDFF